MPDELGLQPLDADEIVALSREYTLYEWVAQDTADPLPVATAQGSSFYTADGRRFLDFNSQSMSVNIGHGDQRVIDAIAAQAQRLAFTSPFLAHEPRARLGRKLAELTPGDLDVSFFTNGGADANENAIKLARQVTGRHKIMARYRSYHGATGVAIAATGDPRRWAAEAGVSGIVRAPEFHRWGRPEPEPAAVALQELEDIVMYEGGHTIAAFILEPVVGANGILIPPDGYLQGVREICDRHSILLIADEVMTGFGRTGRWFAMEHWGVVPDIMTMAKGLTSSYIPFGAVAMRRHIAEAFRERPYVGGLTYNSHPMGCATALAVIDVMEQDGLVERSARLGDVMRGHHERLASRHPSVGAIRNLGLFGALELVRSREPYVPLAPFDGSSEEMRAIHRFLREHGLYAFLRYHMIQTTPPLSISEADLAEGFDIIDAALDIADRSFGA